MTASSYVKVRSCLCLLSFDINHLSISYNLLIFHVDSTSDDYLTVLHAAKGKALEKYQTTNVHLFPDLITDIIFEEMLFQYVVKYRISILVMQLYHAHLLSTALLDLQLPQILPTMNILLWQQLRDPCRRFFLRLSLLFICKFIKIIILFLEKPLLPFKFLLL